MKKFILPALLLTVLTFVTACSTPAANTPEVTEETAEMAESVTAQVFNLTGENFKFLLDDQEAPELRVKEGDTVRIKFTSTGGFHDWVVDEFDAATERVKTGGITFVEFVADKKGTFEYYCSVGEHRAKGMVGNLVVE